MLYKNARFSSLFRRFYRFSKKLQQTAIILTKVLTFILLMCHMICRLFSSFYTPKIPRLLKWQKEKNTLFGWRITQIFFLWKATEQKKWKQNQTTMGLHLHQKNIMKCLISLWGMLNATPQWIQQWWSIVSVCVPADSLQCLCRTYVRTCFLWLTVGHKDKRNEINEQQFWFTSCKLT